MLQLKTLFLWKQEIIRNVLIQSLLKAQSPSFNYSIITTKELTDISSALTHRIDNLEVLLKEIALKQGLTKKEIKQVYQRDLSHEWVNDVE